MRPLRLAFLLPHFRPGGAERVVLNLLRALDRGRFTPHLFLSHAEGAFLELLPDDVRPVELGAARARHLPRRLRQALGAAQIDITYSATNAMNLALLASAIGRGGGRELRIVSEHTSPGAYLAEAKHPRLRRLLMRHLYPRADAIAVPTLGIAEELGKVLGRTALPTLVLPNPVVDAVRLRDRPETAGKVRIVSAGRLVPAKGFDLLLDACAGLDRRGVDFDLAIFGEGPERAALQARIAELNLAGKASLAGHAPDLGAELGRADLFVLASRREGFGNVVVEAMAARVPVLATACDGPRSLISDGENGFLVRPGDPEALAEAMESLVNSPECRASVIGAAAATASRFEVFEATGIFERALLDLTARARPGAVPSGDTSRDPSGKSP